MLCTWLQTNDIWIVTYKPCWMLMSRERERERERETRATLVSEGSPSSVSARNDITVIDHASAAVVNAWMRVMITGVWIRASEWMAKDFDRHSWSGSSARLTASRLHYHLPDFVLPIRIFKLDPADRAVLRVAGLSLHTVVIIRRTIVIW